MAAIVRQVRRVATAILLWSAHPVLAHAQTPATPQASSTALGRALELEQNNKLRDAAAAFREAITGGAAVPGILGLERVYSQLGAPDSMLPVLDALIRERPREPVFRSVQLRTLTTLGRHEVAAQAFEQWLVVSGRDATPYREFARLLLEEGRTGAADTVLQRAQRVLGSGRDFAMELGELRAAMGLWEPAAESWREAVTMTPYLHDAAVFALAPAPANMRVGVLRVMLAPSSVIASRKVAASLALHWGNARDAWEALKALPPGDSAAAAWTDFAERAEGAGAWLVARDALVAALGVKNSAVTAARAAADAASGGDNANALVLAARAASLSDSATAARLTVAVRVQALSNLGRAADAEALLRAYAPYVDAPQRARLMAQVARGWVRAGDLTRARAALESVPEDDRADAAGWIALYEGDLRTARKEMRTLMDQSADAVTALALLARTRSDSSPTIGAAFLALARGDSAAAAARLASAAAEVKDAAPLLLGTAARLLVRRRDDPGAVRLFQQVLEQYPESPEAPEAELEWARALRRAGQGADAARHLEHLILTWPQSALVPQARRELDLARNAVPTR